MTLDGGGSCYGFEVRSDLPLHFLRDGSSPLRLEVREDDRPGDRDAGLVAEWTPRPENRLHARLHATPEGFSLWTDREGWFHIDTRAPSITVPPTLDPVRREERLWGIPAAMCYMHLGDVAVHAAAVEVDGQGLVFGAPGRHGKTTLAAAFLRAGHRVLSEDFTGCRRSPEPSVLPGPALLRLRRDVHGRIDVPGTHPIATDDDKVHLSIDASRRGDGAPVPLRGIVFLRAGDDLALEPVTVEEALPDLFALTFKMPTDEGWARTFAEVTSLAATLPLWNLTRPLRLDRFEQTIEHVIATCLR